MTKYLIFITLFFVCKTSKGQELSRTFYPSQLKEEISVLKESLTTLHPGLYKYNTKQQIEKLFTDLNNNTTKPLNEKDFYLLLAKFTEKIGCGHTYLNPLNLEENIPALYMPKKVLPFCLVVIDRKFIITHNLSSDTSLKNGTEITKINGFNTSQIIDSLLQVSRADGKNALGKKLTNLEIVPEQINRYNLTDIFLPLFFKKMEHFYTIETKTIQNQTSILENCEISLSQRESIYKQKYGLLPKGENLLKVRMLNDSTCYFKIGSFNYFGNKNPFNTIVDSLFAGLSNSSTVKNLILDIRTTEGGNTDARNLLLKYILPKNFIVKDYNERVFNSFLEVPKRLIPFLYTWNKSYLEKKSDTLYKKNELGFYENQTINNSGDRNIEDILVSKNSFKGKVFLLTSSVNSSVAFEVARIFKQYKIGEIIGETTGGTKQGINGSRAVFLRLPYSRIEIDIPILYQAHLGELDEGIVPNYKIVTTQRSIYNGEDLQLDFVQKIIVGKK
jgi:hypothetical protein